MLENLAGVNPKELLETWENGRIKLFLIQRLLRFRRDHSDLFLKGNYLPLPATGALSDCVVSFARERDGLWLMVIAPRLSSRVGFPPIGEKWQDTAVEIPEPLEIHNVRSLFQSGEVRGENRKLMLKDALATLPFAAITNAK